MKRLAVITFTWLVVILTTVILGHYWDVWFEKHYPSTNGAPVVTDTIRPVQFTCSDGGCAHPKVAHRKAVQYRRGQLHHSTWYRHHIPRTLKHKMIHAYKRYVAAHSRMVAGRPVGTGGYRFPSPRQWYRSFSSTVACAFVGTTSHATRMYCSHPTRFHNDLADQVAALGKEVSHVAVKCGGHVVIGGLSGAKAGALIEGMDAEIGGGYGVAIGYADCLWGEYFDRFFW